MTSREHQAEACRRFDHSGQYIELRLTDSSNRTVDEIIAHLAAIARQVQQEPGSLPSPIRLLINSTDLSSNLSTHYLLGQVYHHYSNIIIKQPLRMGIIFHNILLMHVANRLVHLPDSHVVAFRGFRKGESDLAVAWLLSDEPGG